MPFHLLIAYAARHADDEAHAELMPAPDAILRHESLLLLMLRDDSDDMQRVRAPRLCREMPFFITMLIAY